VRGRTEGRAGRDARRRLRGLGLGEWTPGMCADYYFDGRSMRRKAPKERMSKKERRRRRGTDGPSMRAMDRGE